jgi:hypothetical protein
MLPTYSVAYPGLDPGVVHANERQAAAAPMPELPQSGVGTKDYFLALLQAGSSVYLESRRPEGSEGGGKFRSRYADQPAPIRQEGNVQGIGDDESRPVVPTAGSNLGRCALYALLAAVVAGLLFKSLLAALAAAIVVFIACKALNL